MVSAADRNFERSVRTVRFLQGIDAGLQLRATVTDGAQRVLGFDEESN